MMQDAILLSSGLLRLNQTTPSVTELHRFGRRNPNCFRQLRLADFHRRSGFSPYPEKLHIQWL